MSLLQDTPPGMSRGLTFLFAIAGAVAVGNLYWAQPLLATIAGDFGITIGQAGFLVTATQIGYAVGILLFVPLGDVVNRRILVPLALTAACLALASSAFAPAYAALLLSFAGVGMLTTGGQMLPPLAGDIATDAQRGNVVGTIASGMLTGILLSRSISGVLADLFGWRAVFGIAALATLIMAALLFMNVPRDRARASINYFSLIGSVFAGIARYPVVRATLAIGACTFGVFTLFWTGITFLLSAEPYNYSLSQIGLVGLAGLAGAIAAKNAGRLYDRGWSVVAQGIALLITLLSLVLAGFGAMSIFAIILAVIVLDGSVQSVNVLNQVRMMNVEAGARSRMNSAFISCNFVGGAIGSALASIIWPIAGWTGLMCAASVLILIALVIWASWRKRFAELAPKR